MAVLRTGYASENQIVHKSFSTNEIKKILKKDFLRKSPFSIFLRRLIINQAIYDKLKIVLCGSIE